MVQGKLKLNKAVVIIGLALVLLILVFILNNQFKKYTYIEQINTILNIDNVEVKNKKLHNGSIDWSIGEWYVCETYKLSEKDVGMFLQGNKKNELFLTDNSWFRKDWNRTPISDSYKDIQDMITSRNATAGIEKIINEIEKTLFSNYGYYSFLCKPSIEFPQKVVFFLLNIKTNELFIIDVHF